ncbi:hypothetical protein ACFL12_05965 [Pseudomonadota bacterium]
MTRLSLRMWALAGALSAFALAAAPNAAFATDCRVLHTVIESAMLPLNEQYGGHVAKHVIGETAPVGFPPTSVTTAFKSAEQYEDVWLRYQGLTLSGKKTPDCVGTSGAIDKAASVSQLGLGKLKMDKCSGVDGKGVCNAWTETTARNVSFTFAYKSGSWIVYSAFPME